MPTYEYSCKTCGQSFEVFQSFAEKPLRRHEACGGELRKVFHARGIVFKGQGFYANEKRGSAPSDDGPAKAKPEKTAAAAD